MTSHKGLTKADLLLNIDVEHSNSLIMSQDKTCMFNLRNVNFERQTVIDLSKDERYTAEKIRNIFAQCTEFIEACQVVDREMLIHMLQMMDSKTVRLGVTPGFPIVIDGLLKGHYCTGVVAHKDTEDLE